MHGPVIPGPGGEKPRWMPQVAPSSLFSPLVPCWRSRAVEGFTRFYVIKTQTGKYTHTHKRRQSYCDSSTTWASPTMKASEIPKRLTREIQAEPTPPGSAWPGTAQPSLTPIHIVVV